MQISSVTRADLDNAIHRINSVYYQNNVMFNNIKVMNNAATRWQVTLRVKSSKGPGHRLGFSSGGTQRRLVSACWHVHGRFFEALPKGTKIRTGRDGPSVMVVGEDSLRPDFNIGSIMYPMYMSEACEC
jgi:hypothetical protein